MTGQLTIQNRTGHTTIEWDTEDKDGPLDPSIAEQAFNQMVKNGAFAFAETVSGTREQVKEFDPETQAKVTIAPRIAGGA